MRIIAGIFKGKPLKSPKSDNDSVPPDLSAKIMTAILRGTPYPEYLLQTVPNPS